MTSVILDSDFLSAFLKIGKLHRIRDYFQVERLHLPTAALRCAQGLGLNTVNVPAFLRAYRASGEEAAVEVGEIK